MIIDKDKFKEYINDRFHESIHMTEIHSISINNMKYYKDQVPKDSKYHEVVEKNGFVEVIMIKPKWSGWKVVNEKFCTSSKRKELIGTWAYRDSRTNHRYGLEAYQEWLVDVRDKKLESIGI